MTTEKRMAWEGAHWTCPATLHRHCTCCACWSPASLLAPSFLDVQRLPATLRLRVGEASLNRVLVTEIVTGMITTYCYTGRYVEQALISFSWDNDLRAKTQRCSFLSLPTDLNLTRRKAESFPEIDTIARKPYLELREVLIPGFITA